MSFERWEMEGSKEHCSPDPSSLCKAGSHRYFNLILLKFLFSKYPHYFFIFNSFGRSKASDVVKSCCHVTCMCWRNKIDFHKNLVTPLFFGTIVLFSRINESGAWILERLHIFHTSLDENNFNIKIVGLMRPTSFSFSFFSFEMLRCLKIIQQHNNRIQAFAS